MRILKIEIENGTIGLPYPRYDLIINWNPYSFRNYSDWLGMDKQELIEFAHQLQKTSEKINKFLEDIEADETEETGTETGGEPKCAVE